MSSNDLKIHGSYEISWLKVILQKHHHIGDYYAYSEANRSRPYHYFAAQCL